MVSIENQYGKIEISQEYFSNLVGKAASECFGVAGMVGTAAQGLKNVRVWQLKPDVDVYMKFIGYGETCRKFGPPDQENYHAVYDGAAETNDLEALYMKFGNDGSALPAGYRGHSLSMSDVLELYDSTGSSFYYVDRTGFQEMEFAAPQQAQGQTMQL